MGFLDVGSSRSKSSSSTNASQTTPSTGAFSDGTALGLGNISSSGKYGDTKVNLNLIETDAGAVESAMNFAADAFSDASALAADVQRTALSFASDATRDNVALTGRVLDKQTVANLEFLGQVSNFAELSAQTARENAELSERQAAAAMSAVAKANASALDMTNRLAQDTQTATLKALDYVFEAGKSEVARLSESSLKWILIAGVALFVLPLIVKGK